MTRKRFYRTLTLSVLVASLVVLPVTADAAPRDADRHGGVFAHLISTWDWITNLWGAGGGNWDPGRTQSAGPVHVTHTSPAAVSDKNSATGRADRPLGTEARHSAAIAGGR